MYNPYNWNIKDVQKINVGEEIANLDYQIARHRSEIDSCYKEIKALNDKTNKLFERIEKIEKDIERKENDKEEIWENYKKPFCFGDKLSWNE